MPVSPALYNPPIPFANPMVTGLFYDCKSHGSFGGASNTLAGTTVAAIDTIYANRILIPNRIKIVTIEIEVSNGVAGNARLGIYTHNYTTGLTGTLITGTDGGNVDTTNTSTTPVGKTINITLEPGWYWLAAVFSAQPGLKCFNMGTNIPTPGHYTANTSATVLSNTGVTAAHTFAALPSTMTSPAYATYATANNHRIILGT